ncbi:MAG: membrane protein insertion efficiency factor YidD [Rickettsiales bacterium]|nr:MAG: membrane protein insertion efficiency factor YidD [Rickettsiales bacterium]
MKYLLLIFIKFYQYFISPWLGANCRFEPTCSEYAKDAITNFSAIKGSILTIKRLSKCHPFIKADYYDPVPINKKK